MSLTGFGLTDPRADRPCYDLIAEGLSGVMDLTGEASGAPQKIGTPAADLLAGGDAALATLAALLDRQRTGRGHRIDISLLESMTRFMSPRLTTYLGSGELPRRSGAKDSVLAIYQVFETGDEPLTLGIGNDATWRRFCRALGEPDMAEEPRYATNAKRRAVRAELVARIDAVLKTRARDHWLELFAAQGIPAGPILRLDKVVADPGLQSRGLFYRVPGPDGRDVPQVDTGFHLDGAANVPRSAVPPLVEHGEKILRALLGRSEEEIARLRAAGIVQGKNQAGA